MLIQTLRDSDNPVRTSVHYALILTGWIPLMLLIGCWWYDLPTASIIGGVLGIALGFLWMRGPVAWVRIVQKDSQGFSYRIGGNRTVDHMTYKESLWSDVIGIPFFMSIMTLDGLLIGWLLQTLVSSI